MTYRDADKAFVSPDRTLWLSVCDDNHIVTVSTELGLREMSWCKRKATRDERYSNVGDLVQTASQEQQFEKMFGGRIKMFFDEREDINVGGKLVYYDMDPTILGDLMFRSIFIFLLKNKAGMHISFKQA